MAKLTIREDGFLRLLMRSPDLGDGWRNVSGACWPLVRDFGRPEMIEIDPVENGGRVRLSERGAIAIDYI